MKDKEIKEYIKNKISKGLDRTDIVDVLSDSKMTKEERIKALEFYDEEVSEKEKLKLGFFQRRKLRKLIKTTRERAKKDAEIINELTKSLKALNKEERLKLEELKEQMITAILGDKEKQLEGLADVFDVTDEDGSEITKEKLREADVEEVETLLEELLESLEKEI